MDAVVSQWRPNPSPNNIIILFPPSLSLPSRRCSTSIYIHLRLTRQISVLGSVFHYCQRLCDYKKSPSRALSLRREPSGVWVLRRLGRSVNDFLAAAGDPVGKTRVRHQSVCPSRSLKTRPSGKPLRMLEKKKRRICWSWLCTCTKNRRETSNTTHAKVSFFIQLVGCVVRYTSW